MREMACCGRFNIRQWRTNPRIIALFLLTAGYVLFTVEPLTEVCSKLGYNCSPCVFPFITSDASSILTLMICFVILLCDAPFLYPYQKYLMIRTGKVKWAWGQILYILETAVIYWAFVALCSIMALFPHISFSSQWGKVLTTFSQTHIIDGASLSFFINYETLITFRPVVAFILSGILAVSVSFFIGLTITALNMTKYKHLGVIVAVLLVLVQNFSPLSSGYWIYKISPVSWLSIYVVNCSGGKTNMPSLSYVLCCLFAASAFLIFLILHKTRSKSIDLIK